MVRRLSVLVAVAALAVTAGCGDRGQDAATETPAEDTVSDTPIPEPTLPSPSLPLTPPTSPTDTFQKVRVIGTVARTEGAGGSDCVDVVDDNGVTWSLMGADADDLETGQRVSVTGRSRPETGACTGAPLIIQKLSVLP